jgi:hypothetical protein
MFEAENNLPIAGGGVQNEADVVHGAARPILKQH